MWEQAILCQVSVIILGLFLVGPDLLNLSLCISTLLCILCVLYSFNAKLILCLPICVSVPLKKLALAGN